MSKIKWIWIFRIAIVIIFLLLLKNYFINKEVIKNNEKIYIISSVTCKSKSGSSIGIIYNKKYYSVEVTKEDCCNYQKGDKIILNYNSLFDYFFVKNSLYLYLRFVYVSIFVFIISFLPFVKIRTKLFGYLDK